MNIGYARVSTRDQNEARQVEALKAAGISDIYIDKASGKDFDRPEYKRMMRKLKKGDTLFVLSLDRLGRDYTEIARDNARVSCEYAGSRGHVHTHCVDTFTLDPQIDPNDLPELEP